MPRLGVEDWDFSYLKSLSENELWKKKLELEYMTKNQGLTKRARTMAKEFIKGVVQEIGERRKTDD